MVKESHDVLVCDLRLRDTVMREFSSAPYSLFEHLLDLTLGIDPAVGTKNKYTSVDSIYEHSKNEKGSDTSEQPNPLV